MDKDEFDRVLTEIRQSCFHMNDDEAAVVVDKYLEEYPELLDFQTREWLIDNS